MNPKLILSFCFALLAIANCLENEDSIVHKADLDITLKWETELASALVPVIINAFQGLLAHLFKPSDTQDVVLFGRSMRIKLCGDTCVQISDLGSGITEVGTGQTQTDALQLASTKMMNELISKRLLTIYDLCHLNVSFPHPNQNVCPNVQINACDLTHPVITTKQPCTNQHGDTYCERYASRCGQPIYQTLMLTYCFKTCTNGLCGSDQADPCKPSLFF